MIPVTKIVTESNQQVQKSESFCLKFSAVKAFALFLHNISTDINCRSSQGESSEFSYITEMNVARSYLRCMQMHTLEVVSIPSSWKTPLS